MQTILTVDVGIIVAALAPTLAIVVAAVIAKRSSKKSDELTVEIADNTDEKLTGIHTLVNDQLTREKRRSLGLLRVQRKLMAASVADPDSPDDQELLDDLDAQIRELREEVQTRNNVAATLTEAQR